MTDGLSSVQITLTVNGRNVQTSVSSETTLLDILRENMQLTSCRATCGIGVCGSCTVLVDNYAVSACLAPAFQFDQSKIETSEGLENSRTGSRLQEAFIEHQAFQCGFCTPGFLMSAEATMRQPRRHTASDVEAELTGHICRCGSYREILAAVKDVSLKSKPDDGVEKHDGI